MEKIKEKGIIFTTEMVKAILKDMKNNTRRLNGLEKINDNPDEWEFKCFDRKLDKKGNWNLHAYFRKIGFYNDTWIDIKCPYQIGQTLWVRETWGVTQYIKEFPSIVYKADNLDALIYSNQAWNLCTTPLKWKSPRFMPRWASRINLEITNIRVERLQDITEQDAKAEGVYFYGWDDSDQDDYKNYLYNDKGNCDDWGVQTAKESFETLWDFLNAKRSYPWKLNPWVWVIEFKRL